MTSSDLRFTNKMHMIPTIQCRFFQHSLMFIVGTVMVLQINGDLVLYQVHVHLVMVNVNHVLPHVHEAWEMDDNVKTCHA